VADYLEPADTCGAADAWFRRGEDREGATAAASSKGLSLSLDEAVVADIKQLIADAEAGDGVILADLKALGISI